MVMHWPIDQTQLRQDIRSGRHGTGALLSLDFTEGANIWMRLGTNDSATSCRDASSRRWRLGKQGIALQSELKSLLFEAPPANHAPLLVMAHCSANQDIDIQKLARCLAVRKGDLKIADMEDKYGDIYGLVNPFNSAQFFKDYRLLHVFDTDLIEFPPPSKTMMTNFGHRNLSVEFVVDELIGAMPENMRRLDQICTKEKMGEWTNVVFLSGGDIFAGSAFANRVFDNVNEKLGQRSGTGFGTIDTTIISRPQLAVSKDIDSYHRLIVKQVQDALGNYPLERSLIVPTTISLEYCTRLWLQENPTSTQFLFLTDALNGHDIDRSLLGSHNDVNAMRRLKSVANTVISTDFTSAGVMDEMEAYLGVEKNTNKYNQKLINETKKEDILQVNLLYWYFVNFLAPKKISKALISKSIFLHDLAAEMISDEIISSKY